MQGEVRESRTAPEAKPPGEQRRGERCILLLQGGASLGEQPLEPGAVEIAWVELEHVPRRASADEPVTERFAERRHVDLQELASRLGRPSFPELLDEGVRRHDLVGAQEEERQQRPVLRGADRDLAVVPRHLERTQDPELHLPPSSPARPLRRGGAAWIVVDRGPQRKGQKAAGYHTALGCDGKCWAGGVPSGRVPSRRLLESAR